jgi:hypothetical protein
MAIVLQSYSFAVNSERQIHISVFITDEIYNYSSSAGNQTPLQVTREGFKYSVYSETCFKLRSLIITPTLRCQAAILCYIIKVHCLLIRYEQEALGETNRLFYFYATRSA